MEINMNININIEDPLLLLFICILFHVDSCYLEVSASALGASSMEFISV